MEHGYLGFGLGQKVEELITHRCGLNEAVKALEVMRDGVDIVKIMLLCSQ